MADVPHRLAKAHRRAVATEELAAPDDDFDFHQESLAPPIDVAPCAELVLD
jgi:hypothetical protein